LRKVVQSVTSRTPKRHARGSSDRACGAKKIDHVSTIWVI
jgi:hypothetical protein